VGKHIGNYDRFVLVRSCDCGNWIVDGLDVSRL